jgi:hypothetical protein
MKRNPPPTEADKKRIANYVKAGGTVKNAADIFKVIPDTVRQACEEHNVEIPKGGARW